MTTKPVWKFEVQRSGTTATSTHGYATSTDYGTGETEAEAIRDLAVKRKCESAGYDTGACILTDANMHVQDDDCTTHKHEPGRWVLVCADGTDLYVSRGVKLA